MPEQSNKHDASAAATGYLFQCRFALLVGLEAISDNPEFQLSIEKFDDIAFEAAGTPIELIQTKHHLKNAGSLADASVDLWKTLNIWAKLAQANSGAPFRIRLFLVTTSVAPDGSAASYLRVRDRNESKAQQILLQTAAKSKNKTNTEGYKGFKNLSEALQLSLLKAVTILDGSANIIDVREDICRALRMAVAREHVEHMVERLEGWWFNVVIKALTSGGAISVLAIDNRIDELREEFRRAALPVDFESTSPSPSVVAELDRRPFVQQLRRIDIGTRRVEYAIRDYYRASEQRARWAREELLVDGELEKYEQELIEAWQPRFMAMVDELPQDCEAIHKVASGQALFKWVEIEALFPLRTVRHRFLTHGSFHILANRYVVGWHPDYAGDAELDHGKEKG